MERRFPGNFLSKFSSFAILLARIFKASGVFETTVFENEFSPERISSETG